MHRAWTTTGTGMRRTATLLTAIGAASFAFAGETLSTREYEERCASYYARQYDVSPALVRAVIQVESAWQPGVVSSKGAMGLMQLMPATAEHFGVTHPFYIHENVRGGVAYLAELQKLFRGRPAAGYRSVCCGREADSSPRVGLFIRRGLHTRSADCATISRRVEAERREVAWNIRKPAFA